MKKNLPIIIIVAVLAIGGIAFAYSNNQNNKNAKKNETVAMEMKKAEELAMEKEKMTKEGEVMTQKGSYTTYDQAKLANAEKGDVVLFFHAGWCPKCQESDKNFKASATPDGLTILKIDYDNSTELRQKYGVTIQHTFVQVDKAGNELKQWNGSYSYDDIKSQVN